MIPWYLMAKGKGGVGYKTASGPIVSVSDALAAPLRSLVANIEPVQEGSGDPSPDNVRPISGWSEVKVTRAGKNLLDYSAFQQYANWSDSIATYGDYPTSVGNKGYLLPTVSGVTYTISLGISSSSFPIYCYLCRANGSDTSERVQAFTTGSFGAASITFTAGSGWIYYVRLGSTNNESLFTTQMEKVANAQLELGSNATTYAPYQGNTYTIQLGDTYYGGTLDVTNGVLTVDREAVTLPIRNPVLIGTYSDRKDYGWNFPQKAIGLLNIWSQAFKTNSVNGVPPIYCVAGRTANKYVTFGVPLAEADDAQSAGDYIRSTSPKIVIELATPIEIPLTPTEISTLQGANNVWADTGDMTIEYLASGGANADLMKLAVAFMGRD